MKVKIWQKLAIAIVLISMIIVTIASLLSMQSFSRGFLSYINELEKPKIERLKRRLISDYQRESSWDFLIFNPHHWNRYTRKANDSRRRPPRRREGNFDNARRPPPPPLWREKGDFRRPPPRDRDDNSRRPPPPNRALDAIVERADGNNNDGKPPEHFALLDTDLQLVVGKIKLSDPALNHPLMINQQLIGYLHVEPFVKLTDKLDQRFIAHQQKSSLKIALLAVLLSLLGAWILARYLRNRLSPLSVTARDYTDNNYSSQIPIKQNDELGQLAQDINLLGRTLEKNQTARQQWIADISHELRTPLSILSGELEAIEDGIRPLNQQSIQSLSSETKRLKKLVEDLYQLSLSDLGAMQYSWEQIDLGQLISDVLNNFETRFAEKSLNISSDCNVGNGLFISGDRGRLHQLFSNLFENSCRYTNADGQLSVSCEQQKNNIIIKIADSSPSVPPEQLDKIFDRLHRVEKSRNRKTGGAGLGLTIVQAIIEAHEGEVSAQTSSLGGLEVTIKIPMVSNR